MRLISKQKNNIAALYHLAVLGVIGLIVLGTYSAAAGPMGRFDRRAQALRARLATAAPTDQVQITVVLREPEGRRSRAERRGRVWAKQNATLARLKRGKFTLKNRYRWLSGFSGWADAETIAMLNADPNVLRVDVDRVAYMAASEGTALVGADTVQALGVTGSGVAIAMLDTGIDSDHPNLSSSLVAEACFCDNQPGPAGCCPDGSDVQTGPGSAEDDQGHGTGTTGVIVSSSASHLGVAPDAGIVALKVLDASGAGLFSDVADALDWVIDNHVTHGIKVVNLSLSDGGQYNNAAASPCSGTNTANAIADLKMLGISVYTASGNEGHDSGISFPACVSEAISVGGVYDASFPSVNWCGATCATSICTDTPAPVDSFVCHSNSGSLLDLLAPDYLTSTTGIGGGTAHLAGTSIASPYAAGQAALLLEAVPTLTPDEIVSWLKFFAPQVTNPDNGLSFPRTRVDIAVEFLLAECGNGTVELGELCDDGNTDSGDCCDSACFFEATGSSCDDTDLCTTTDTCDGAGVCVGSGTLSCDDLNACTNDSCLPATGCDFAPNTDPCDDSDACTNGDICSGGSCAPGAPIVCDDSNFCTNDSCIPATGCDFAPNTNPCDDSNACTNGDICSGGSCVPGTPIVCDDTNLCTNDSCIPATGCDFAPNTNPCDDSDACTSGDVCAGGSCMPGAPIICDDTNLCTDDSCIPATGCDFAPNTNPCDDSDACTNGDICTDGACVSGAPIVCDDTNLCTDDSCIPATGCDFAPNTAACDDTDACTDGDVCAGGSCISGSTLDCDDGDACTADACDEITGCSNSPIVGCSAAPMVPSLGPAGFVLLIGLLAFTSVAVIRMNLVTRPGL